MIAYMVKVELNEESRVKLEGHIERAERHLLSAGDKIKSAQSYHHASTRGFSGLH